MRCRAESRTRATAATVRGDLRSLANQYAEKGKDTVTKSTTKTEFVRCTCEQGGTSETDKDAVARAEQIVKEAFRVLVQGSRHLPQDCLSCRAQLAIRRFAGTKATFRYRLCVQKTRGFRP
jgi:hypothetical protein